mgnify:CR=1 FL=1
MINKRLLYPVIFLLLATVLQGQTKKTKPAVVSANPVIFTIEQTEFESLFNYKSGEVIRCQKNKYIDKSVMELNTRNGNMQLLRIKSAYFAKSLLMVQVSGQLSVQVFIVSTDKKTFYRGKTERGKVTMSRCKEEDIVTE